jgi:hypothetical protein
MVEGICALFDELAGRRSDAYREHRHALLAWSRHARGALARLSKTTSCRGPRDVLQLDSG